MATFCVSCSTKKNTAMNRFWHSFTSRYNTYYNGTLAYIDASLEKEKGNKDNFTERIPLYTVGNKASRDLGKGNYETAITKSKKIIQLHSIKAKPEWTKSRKKTEKDIEWLSRKEYNPFMWRAWMLMGRSQFYQGKFDEAASTFAYMSRLYKGQPSIYGKARAWLAKCYIESDWLYDAEDVIRNMERDTLHWKAVKEWDYTYADYYLHTNDLPKAAEYLRKVIKHEMRSKQRAREYYLLGQIEAAQGNKTAAYKAFRKCVRQNPPYELDFNARISMTEVMAQGQAKKMISRLKRMARNDNNKDYLDQVYYAIGNIYLAEKDTANAISAYEKGNEKATRSGIEKGVLLLHLGDLYWEKEKYSDAQRCYGAAIGMLDKERPDYKLLSERSKVLDELVPFTDAIHLQDSLQVLAKMDEKERNAAIDRVIEELKKKEKEEEAKAAEEELERRQQQYGGDNRQNRQATPTAPVPATQRGSSTWYFYNPQAVMQGKQSFERTWGKRENKDNWRRTNKTVVGGFGFDEDTQQPETALTEEQRDSIAAAEELAEKEQERLDSAINDPHKREYYMAQIPFTEEAVAASNEIIKDGLVKSGIIFKDKLDNLPLSEKQFTRLLTQYPEFEPKDEVFYHLFLLYSRKAEHEKAETFIDSLKACCPDSKWTALLTDPYFAENAMFGKQMEDSIYGATYEAFKADRFQEVYDGEAISSKRFPMGANRDRFIFISGLTHLNDGDAETCLSSMETVVKDYPLSKVGEMAGMIINGVKAGRALHGAKFDLTNVWDRRNAVMGERDSTLSQDFSADRNTNFLFILAYPQDSINENKLLFQLARYNFTSFLVRDFDIRIENSAGMRHMIVGGFRNFNEARQYARLLVKQEGVKATMGKARAMVISEQNLPLIGARYSYNDYDSFYVANFAPLAVEHPEQLYEPTTVRQAEGKDDDDPVKAALPTEDVAPGGAKPIDPNAEQDELGEDELLALPPDVEITMPEATETEIPTDSEATPTEDNGITLPTEGATELPQSQDVEVNTQPESTETPATNNVEVAIPQETTIVPPAESMTVDVPQETTPTPSAEETIVETPQEEAQPVATAGEQFEIADQQADSETAKPAEDTFDIPSAETPQAEEEVIELPADEPAKAAESAETVVFDEAQPTETPAEAEELITIDDKPTTEDLEDEYYELDGF